MARGILELDGRKRDGPLLKPGAGKAEGELNVALLHPGDGG